jgi:hypothetical protein
MCLSLTVITPELEQFAAFVESLERHLHSEV